MIKVAVFDDNHDRRDSLAVLLMSDPDFELCGAFSDCNNVIRDLEQCNPDVVLMDIDMPGVNGIEATRLIKAKRPEVHVVIQTVFENEESIFNSIKAGASGYLLKSSKAERILFALRDVMEGGAPLTPSIASRVIRHFQEQPEVQHPDYGLSDREREVLGHLVLGKSYKMIADEMFISYNTVNSHIKKIYEKLQVHSVSEAVSKAINQKLVV